MPQPKKVVRVITPIYEAELGDVGATLLSWRLTRYRESLEKDSGLIELVSFEHGFDGPRPLQVAVDPKLDEVLNRATFQFDQEELVLERPGETGTIRAVAELRGGYELVKEFTFFSDSYSMEVNVLLKDPNGNPLGGKLGLLWPHYLSKKARSRWAGFAGPVVYSSGKFKEIKKLEKFLSKEIPVQWAGYGMKYFLSAIVPLNKGTGTMELRRQDDSVVIVIAQEADQKASAPFRFKLYLGPKDLDLLKREGHDLSKAINFGFFDLIARPLLYCLKWIHGYTSNFGIAIIVLTIFIKLIFWPLTHKSYKSMKELQRLQPRIKQIRERFKDDKEQMNREMMLLYRTHKVNPMGGCLPMLLQIPVFFALYKTLLGSIELRQAPFAFWVKDLAAPDYLIRFPQGVSIFGIEGIGPLPLIMGLSMLIQQKLTPTTMGDPTQAKIMMLMPIFFTFIFISFPSGLVLYWLVNNLLSIVQQVYINLRVD